jgi:hypothetical protein
MRCIISEKLRELGFILRIAAGLDIKIIPDIFESFVNFLEKAKANIDKYFVSREERLELGPNPKSKSPLILTDEGKKELNRSLGTHADVIAPFMRITGPAMGTPLKEGINLANIIGAFILTMVTKKSMAPKEKLQTLVDLHDTWSHFGVFAHQIALKLQNKTPLEAINELHKIMEYSQKISQPLKEEIPEKAPEEKKPITRFLKPITKKFKQLVH